MIVKNESHVIRRCLDSVIPLIDYWVIVDTGSTDGTQKIIKEHMKNIPGELVERPWKNFAESRNEALDFARDRADYILFLDADDWLEYEEGFCWPQLTKEAYQLRRGPKGFSSLMIQIVKASIPFKWEGVVQEYLSVTAPYSIETLSEINYVAGQDGYSYYDPQKYRKYIELLEGGLKEEPRNRRYVFYLAESYRCAGEYSKALEIYQKRVDMEGWDQEVFWSLLQIAHLQKRVGMNEETIIASYQRAHRYRPHRLEPIYFLAEYYNQNQHYALAYELIKGAPFLPTPKEPDILFREEWIKEWGLNFQLSIAAYYLCYYKESLELCHQLQQREDLPEIYREQVAHNINFPLEKLGYARTALRAALSLIQRQYNLRRLVGKRNFLKINRICKITEERQDKKIMLSGQSSITSCVSC